MRDSQRYTVRSSRAEADLDAATPYQKLLMLLAQRQVLAHAKSDHALARVEHAFERWLVSDSGPFGRRAFP